MEKVAHLPKITGSILEISSLMVSKALSKVLLVTRLTINISYLISYGNSDYHSHASGTRSTKKIGYSYAWQQGPSVQDIRTAKGNEIVFGMGSGIIYKYNKNGVFATIPISIFK